MSSTTRYAASFWSRSALSRSCWNPQPISIARSPIAEAGITVHLASSLACARVREALYTSWDKHDRKDAQVLVHLLTHDMTKPFHDPLREGHVDIQEISNTYHQIALARARCQHSLVNHYLTLYFPEMERYLHTSRAVWFCRFLLAFPTPSRIMSLDCDAFVATAWHVVGRKVAKTQFLHGLYETGQSSMGLPIPLDSPALDTFRLELQCYLTLTEQRQELESFAATRLKNNTDFLRLQTLPGVGPIIALMILTESGDLKRFRHHRQYLKFCGFNLAASQSGNSCNWPNAAMPGCDMLTGVFLSPEPSAMLFGQGALWPVVGDSPQVARCRR